jgi:hypothetical protein
MPDGAPAGGTRPTILCIDFEQVVRTVEPLLGRKGRSETR